LVITIAGLVSMAFRGLNYGLDFSSGTRLDLAFQQTVSTGQVRQALSDLGYGYAKVQVTGADSKEVIIVTKSLSTEDRRTLQSNLGTKVGQFEVRGMDDVGPEFSRELVNMTVWAVIIASLGMLIYITIRFEYRFATAGIIALLHDALILLGIFSLIGKEINIPFVAALLTMLGYSINDTIVVYDRIRENLRLRKKGEDLEALVNRSIGGVVWRSVGTSVTTLLAIAAVYVFGGSTTKDFALALLIGITSGTYSSIFIASPIWLMWRNADERKKLQARLQAKAHNQNKAQGKTPAKTPTKGGSTGPKGTPKAARAAR
jgi:preprotein translocase subunit SecF